MSDLELVRTILQEFPYGLLGSLVAAILCGYLSVFIVSKRIVFVGATLTQVAVASIALSHLLLPHDTSEIGSMAIVLGVVVFLSRLLRSTCCRSADAAKKITDQGIHRKPTGRRGRRRNRQTTILLKSTHAV